MEKRASLPSQKSARENLAQKEHRLGIHREATIPALFRHIEEVAALQNAHPGIVDECRERAELRLDLRERRLVSSQFCDVEGHRDHRRSVPGDACGSGRQFVVGRQPVDCDGEPFPRQGFGSGKTDTA